MDKNQSPGLLEQEGETHADEGKTSMRLYIAPEPVAVRNAGKDYDPRPGRKGLTRVPEEKGHFTPAGIWGDPTLATREKRRIIVEATIRKVVQEIRESIALKIGDG